MLITDQGKLAKLALSLRGDIEFLLESIKLDPVTPNEFARSQFLEGIFHFLRQATDLTSERIRNHLFFSGTPLEAGTVRPASAPPPPPSSLGLYRGAGDGYLNHASYRDRRPRIAGEIFHRYPNYEVTFNPDQCLQYIEPHSIWFPNAPCAATPALVAEQIFGGPLESIRWYKHFEDDGLSYLINFLDHKGAAVYLAFSKTPAYQMKFPGVNKDWKPFMTWSANINTIRTNVLRAALDPTSAARRVLIFHNFPAESVSKFEMKQRLKALERRFLVQHWVDIYEIYPNTAVAYIVFSKIESAMRVMGWHGVGLLGPEFENCEAVYGRDPSDQPIPEIENDVATNLSPPLPRPPSKSLMITLAATPPLIALSTAIPTTPPTTNSPSPLIELSPLIDVPPWTAPHLQAPSAVSSGSSALGRPGYISESSSSDTRLSPARLTDIANFSEKFFAQEWDGGL